MRNSVKLKKMGFIFVLILLMVSTGFGSEIDADESHVEEQQLYGQGMKKISDINILLPIQNCVDCRKAYKVVTAFNGCYQWKISHPNLVSMRPIPSDTHPDCVNRVEISNVQQRETKSLVWLTA